MFVQSKQLIKKQECVHLNFETNATFQPNYKEHMKVSQNVCGRSYGSVTILYLLVRQKTTISYTYTSDVIGYNAPLNGMISTAVFQL